MADLKWYSFLEIGIDFIDEEHKALLKIMQEIRSEIEANNYEAAAKLLELLLVEANTHFLSEEKYLEETGYPGLEEHKKYHNELLSKTEITKQVCENITTAHDTKECFDEMADFLIDDILKGDVMFKSYLEYKGYIKN